MNLFDVYPLYDIEISKGEGAWITDKKGARYLDFYGGHAVISIGHSHPHYVKSLQKQVAELAFYSNSVVNPLQQQLARMLGSASGYEDYSLFLVNSGAEANENALKLASFHNGRSSIISFRGGFHGRTSAAVNITDNEKIIAPINRGFHNIKLDLEDFEGIEHAMQREEIAAIIVEGIQGIAGIYQPSAAFLTHLRKMADKYGSVLILDEIQSGYGRSGTFFAHQQQDDLRPDLITIAKGMGNGFPIGGVMIAPHFQANYGLLGTTFGGNHLGCAAGISVLEVINEEQLLKHAKAAGAGLLNELASLRDIKEVRGQGLMIGIELPFPVKELRAHLLHEENVFVGSAAEAHTIRLLPPLNISPEEVDIFLNALKRALTKIKS